MLPSQLWSDLPAPLPEKTFPPRRLQKRPLGFGRVGGVGTKDLRRGGEGIGGDGFIR